MQKDDLDQDSLNTIIEIIKLIFIDEAQPKDQ